MDSNIGYGFRHHEHDIEHDSILTEQLNAESGTVNEEATADHSGNHYVDRMVKDQEVVMENIIWNINLFL